MKTIKINGVWFKGQYAENVERLMEGEVITMSDFNNGKWEATSKISHFVNLLYLANYSYRNLANVSSLRQMQIKSYKNRLFHLDNNVYEPLSWHTVKHLD